MPVQYSPTTVPGIVPDEFVKNLQSLLQSHNSLINQACSGPYQENIGPRSLLYGTRCARSVLSRPRAIILPVGPSRLVDRIYIRDEAELAYLFLNLCGDFPFIQNVFFAQHIKLGLLPGLFNFCLKD